MAPAVAPEVTAEKECVIEYLKEKLFIDGRYAFIGDLNSRQGLRRLAENIIGHVKKRLYDRLNPTNVEASILAAEAFYDSVLAPIDLSLIPNLVEGYFDRALRHGIRPLILFAADEIRSGVQG